MHRKASVLALSVTMAMCVGACDTDIGDQSCTEESLFRDRDDKCPYGEPGGPAVTISSDNFCPAPFAPTDIDEDGTGCATEFTWSAVFDIFTNPNLASGGGNCTGGTCHGVAQVGAVPAFDPPMYATDSRATHESLMKYGVTRYGRPYIRGTKAGPEFQGQPEEAWILCNLHSLRGSLMPKPFGFKTPELDIVSGWVNCGMNFDNGGGAGAAGGGGAGVGGEPIAGAGGQL